MNSYNLDIRTVCAQLNTTSRTLRYYEEKGLIKSVRDGANSSRKYEVSEVEKIRRILFLRKLGLSVEDAKSIVNVEKNTNEVIKEKYAFLFA